jgi:hypothetical protein
VRGACAITAAITALVALLATGCSSGGNGGPRVASLSAGSGSASHKAASGKANALNYARCMRSHGVTKFPDPQSNGQLRIAAGPGTGLDPNSSVFKAAQAACKSLEPRPPE